MTFYRARYFCPSRTLLFAVLAGLWLVTMPALAQVDLRPDQPVQTRPAPSHSPQPQPAPEPLPVTKPERGDVVTSSLAPIEPLSISLLSPSQGGISGNVWTNSSAYALTKLLDNMPGQGPSPLLNDMLARSLLSGGDVPASAKAKADLQHARLQALYDLGRLGAVIELVDRSPGGREDPQAAVHAVDALLAQSKNDAACELGQRKGTARGGLYWRKLRAFCMAVSGNIQGAELTAGLLAEEKEVGADFLEQILAITAPPAKPGPKTRPVAVANALELAMARAGKQNINPTNLPLALAVGLMDKNLEDRITLTLKAVSAGAAPARVLAKPLLEDGAPPPPLSPAPAADGSTPPPPDPAAEQAQWFKSAKSDQTLHGLASLYWLARNATDTPVRAQAIQAILHRPAKPSERLAFYRLVSPLAANVMPASDLTGMAVDFTRLALLRDDPTMALLWFQQAPEGGPQAEDMDVALYALGGKVLVNARNLTKRLHGDAATKDRLFRALLIADALRDDADPALRTVLAQFDTADTCPAGPLAALHNAARASAKGETVLRAHALPGNEPLSALPVTCGAGIVRALRSAGFDKQARVFAMEWLFASQWKDG